MEDYVRKRLREQQVACDLRKGVCVGAPQLARWRPAAAEPARGFTMSVELVCNAVLDPTVR